MPNNSLSQHCREIVQRFLLTAVVIDDELSVPADPPVHGNLEEPDPHAPREAPTLMDPHPHPPRPLNVDPITWSFARQGMVCGMISPHEGEQARGHLAKAVARADIVILDWRLNRRTGADASPLLKRILMEDQQHRLRLIAFYTGEPDQEAIRDKIAAVIQRLGLPCRTFRTTDQRCHAIGTGASRIVVYAKPGSHTRNLSSVVREEELANQLIADFSGMVEGLLPCLVLTALAAVRENVYRVLERFGHELDPAFLAHRACLPHPTESEQHIVEQIASELHGIMDDAVGGRKPTPTGIDAIKLWLADRFGGEDVVFGPNKEMSLPQVLEMLAHGVEEKPGPLKKAGKDFDILSRGFSGGDSDSRKLDLRLASVMSFRQVLEGTRPQLSMGTVVRRVGAETDATLLCVTPRCDSVRLKRQSSFLFLPLSDHKPYTPQLVVPTQDNEHRHMTVSMNPSLWKIVDFLPDPEQECVLAACEPGQPFTFKGVPDGKYLWVGELKAEFSQSIAQSIAERMSRMPLNKSEWLRRSERV